MKRYFTYKRPDKFWAARKVAYWVFDGEVCVSQMRIDGTEGCAEGYALRMFSGNSCHPELTEPAALALLDEPWKVAGEGWRLLGNKEIPDQNDEVYLVSKKGWVKSMAESGITVDRIVNVNGKGNVMAYRRRVAPMEVWPRWFVRGDFKARVDSATAQGVFGDGSHAECFKLDYFIDPANDWRELTQQEISQLTVNNNNTTKESSKESMNDYKVGDKLKSGKFPAWGTLTVKHNSGDGVICASTTRGDGFFFFSNAELALVKSLPTKFQVDTRGLEGVQVMLIALHKERYPHSAWITAVDKGRRFFVWGVNKLNSLDWNPTELPVSDYTLLSLDEAITILTTKPEPKVVEVKLNATYTAIVTQGKDTVKVGCQEISISAIKELVKAIDEVAK